MIKQMVVGFYQNLMLGYWVWILRALAEFKESGRSPGLLEDFEDGYYKTLRLPIRTSGTRCSGYHMTIGSKSGEFQFKGEPIFDSRFMQFVFRISGIIKL